MSAPAADPLQAYLSGVEPTRARLVGQVHGAILEAHPGFDIAVKYRMLMYALDKDWRHWVCAIDAHPKAGVALRFLFGVLLKDPRHVLRPGSSVLMTWDLASGDPVDPAALGAYVMEAVARYPEYRANARGIEAAAKAASLSSRPKTGS